ncbi:hypothetical protein L7F22_039397 [Adiantum nelumboides]|nr:hypothetical protein [Adiantum nelumboides]
MSSNSDNQIQWHSQYDIKSPPVKPEGYVRFIVISDTHSTQPKVPDGDVLLHSGDLTDIGGTKAFEEQLAWLGTLPHRYKFIIGGNHDFGLDDKRGWYSEKGKFIHAKFGFNHASPEEIRKAVAQFESQSKSDGRNKYVEDEQIEFSIGEKIWTLYGSPWSPEFGGWAWNYKRGQEAKELYDRVKNSDILLTHTPPHNLGRLDVITDGKTHVGCEELTKKFENGDLRPLLHCFGHIHEAYGSHLQTWDNKSEGHPKTLLLNAALVEMNTKMLLAESAMKLPILTLLRWLGYQRPAWLQVGLKYSVKNL